MKINATNTEKLTAAIAEAEGRAKVRTVSAGIIQGTLKKIMETGCPKNKLNGTKVHWDDGQYFPKAYGHCPISTHWEAEFKNGKWYVTDIKRATCPNIKRGPFYVSFSDEAKAWILDKASVMAVKFYR